MGERLALALRRFYRRHTRPARGAPGRGRRRGAPAWLSVALGVLLALALVRALEARLRPVARELTVARVDNEVTSQINDALSRALPGWEVDYSDLVTIQRDEDGAICALISDMGQLNLLRSQVVQAVLETIDSVDVHTLGVPLGSLLDLDILWARGPRLQVKSLVAGTVSVEADSQFLSTGINQTLHRLLLDIQVPLTVLLPGGGVETQVSTTLCVAETVIVGQVPETYLDLDGGG